MKALKILVLALATFTAAGAQAGVVTYNGFSNTTGLTTVGSAKTESTADGTVMRLTPNQLWQSGAMYSTNSIALGQNATFSTTFQFRMNHSGNPADGLGQSGAGMGYAGVNKSVIIEFDTYNNGWSDGNSNNQVPRSRSPSIRPGGQLSMPPKPCCAV